MDLSLKIDTIESISRQEFLQRYFYHQKPVIIKGLIKNTGAEFKWSFPYIKNKLGNTHVGVFDNTKAKNSAYTKGDKKMNFGNFIDIIQKDEKCNYRLFLFNGFRHAPELREDYPCPEIFSGILDRVGLMFFGGKNTGVRMHYDIDMSNVLHTQFIGKKRIILIHPKYSKLLYQIPFSTFSMVDFENLDINKYPALKQVKGYDITLVHGDSLFMPSGYWHYITYLEGGFAVTYRKLPLGLKSKIQAVYNLTVLLIIDKFIDRVHGKIWKGYRERIAINRANANINYNIKFD